MLYSIVLLQKAIETVIPTFPRSLDQLYVRRNYVFLTKQGLIVSYIQTFMVQGNVKHCHTVTNDWIVSFHGIICPNVGRMTNLQWHEFSKLIYDWSQAKQKRGGRCVLYDDSTS